MKIQNIQNNTPNFNGRVALIGKLSEIPAKCVEKNKQNLSDLLYPKNFDLYIKEDAKDKFLELTAVKPAHYLKGNKPRVNYKVYIPLLEGKAANKEDLLLKAAGEAVADYSKIKQPLTFREKAEKFLNKSMEKFVKIFQDADEV